MEEDVTKIYEEYSEELLFCKYFIAEKLKHHAEMGRCGENILKKCLQERFQMLEFVTGFIAWANHQSPQEQKLEKSSRQQPRACLHASRQSD